MFEKDIQDAISKFDGIVDIYDVIPDDILNEIKDTNDTSVYKEFKNQYDLFNFKKNIKEIHYDLEQLYQNNPEHSYNINRFIGSLYLCENDFLNAKEYFLLCNDFEDAIYPCIELFNQTQDIQYMNEALDIAKKSLENVCKPKSKDDEENEYIDYPIFRLVMEDCLKKDDFSYIISLIDTMYSSFRKNDKYETFYYSLIKLASIKDIKLSFQQNKDFFSRENFQTVCYKIKEVLSNNSNDVDTVISFEEKINIANNLKNKKDFLGAETQYREAISIASNLKQRCLAFNKIYEMYENIDSIKMLSILDEFENDDVFENDFQKYYAKSKMIIKTKSINSDTIDILKLLFQSLESIETDNKYPSKITDLVVKCLELLKLYVQDMLNKDLFNDAHTGCKLALKFIDKFNKKNHYKINEYRTYFNSKQKRCGDIKKDLAKKGNAKIPNPVVAPVIDKTPIIKQSVTDPNDLPMFTFNGRILDYNQSNSFIEDNSNLDEENIKQQIKSLIQQVKISQLIKSIYIQNDVFVGNPKQARSDIDFYLNSTIRTNYIKKRDEYLSFVKIIQDVISRFGEDIHYKITKDTIKKYILEAITYHSKCLDDKMSIQYLLFIELIKKEKISTENLLEIFNESE
ncbi:MAG: hypothetical protein ACI4WH_05840 [Oscillospiraceae bacterium]